MNFRDMLYFCQVAECGSYKLAAEQLFVSQPALSHSVKVLEEELGFSLFEKQGRHIRLTPEGQIAHEHLQRVLAAKQNIQDYFSQITHKPAPVVLVMTAIFNPLFGAMAELSHLPGLRLEQIAIHRDYLRQHPWDLVIFSEDRPSMRVSAVPLVKEDFCFVVHKNHPLAACSSLTLAQTADYSFVLPSRCNEAGNLLYINLQKEQAFPRVFIESDDYFCYPSFLQENYIGIVPRISSGLQNFSELRLIPWADCRCSRTVYLAANPSKELSPYALHVQAHIVQYFKNQR